MTSILLLAACSSLSAADDELDKYLAREKWRENAFGVSLRPPLDTRIHQFNSDDALVRITKDDIYTISLYIKRTQQDHTIDQVVRAAIEQFGFVQPTAKILDQRVIKPAGRPGWVLHFGVNLPLKDLPDAKVSVEALAKIAREQLTKADALRERKRDIEAYRLYRMIADNSPDRVVAAKALQWMKHYGTDNAFMRSFILDETRRRKVNKQDADAKPWVMSQAFMQLSPQIFVMIRMDVDHNQFAATRPVLEAVLDSLEVQNPKELSDLRKKMLEDGNVLARTINHKRLVEAMLPEVRLPIVDDFGRPDGFAPLRLQYLRITKNEQDIGWMKTVHRERRDQLVTIRMEEVIDERGKRKQVPRAEVEEVGVNGIGVDVYARIHLTDRVIDTHSQTFQSETGKYESWSIRSTVRLEAPKVNRVGPLPGEPGAKGVGRDPGVETTTSWLETGVRNEEQITIIREGPTGVQRYIWQKPPMAYVSQVELYLMAPLLPRENGEYGFYAYYPNTGSVSFRKIRVVPSGDGGFRVFSQPTPDSPEQRSDYDREGQLTGRELGEGMELTPTTRDELAKLYQIKLPDETVNQPKPKDFKPLPPSNRLPR
ncbi:MAG: hypothetical protein WD768_02565 [Phycisphaeraceae bacterium]